MIECTLFNPGTFMLGFSADGGCISIFLGFFGIDIYIDN